MSDKLAEAFIALANAYPGHTQEAPFTPSKDQEATKDSDIIMKALNEEERLVLGVVLEPEVYDLHKDIYSAEEVRKACTNFNTHCMQANLGHEVNIDNVDITKSFILEVDAMIGDQSVKAGSWLMEMHAPSDAIWKEIKEEGFTGYSIGGSARVEDV